MCIDVVRSGLLLVFHRTPFPKIKEVWRPETSPILKNIDHIDHIDHLDHIDHISIVSVSPSFRGFFGRVGRGGVHQKPH